MGATVDRRPPAVSGPCPETEPAWLVAFRQLAAEAVHRRDQDDRLARAARARAARRAATERAARLPPGRGLPVSGAPSRADAGE